MRQDPLGRTPRPQDDSDHTRWNFAVIVTESSFFMSGLAWVDVATVLPLFISALLPSLAGPRATVALVVGLIPLVQQLGWKAPQLFMAAVVGHRPRRLPFLRWPVLLGRLPFFAFVAFLWLRGVADPGAVIPFLLLSYACISLGNGILGISWHDIIAKSIPPRLRGRFFGAMQFATASAALGVGFAVRWVLGPTGPGYPSNYTLLFTGMALFLALSTAGCWLVREPIRPVLDRPQSVWHILFGAIRLLSRHRPFRYLVMAVTLGFGVSLTAPFYMLYAKAAFQVEDQLAGVYIWAATLGGAASSICWAYLNDRRGPRAVVRAGCALILATPLLAILLPPAASAAGKLLPAVPQALPYLFSLVFLLAGSTIGAMWMGPTNYLYELATHQDRPRYLASFHLCTLPAALLPLCVGLLLRPLLPLGPLLAYPVVFLLVAGCGAAALLSSILMPPPTTDTTPDTHSLDTRPPST